MTGYINEFNENKNKNTITMSLKVKDKKIFKNCNKIWKENIKTKNYIDKDLKSESDNDSDSDSDSDSGTNIEE